MQILEKQKNIEKLEMIHKLQDEIQLDFLQDIQQRKEIEEKIKNKK